MDLRLEEKLRHIERNDPDGDPTRTTPPMAEDYSRHKRWAIKLYGDDVWRTYIRGGWYPEPEV